MLNKGALIEYAEGTIPLLLGFEFNPESISFSRSISTPTKTTQAKSKKSEKTANLGITSDNVTFSLNFMLDATDRMNDDTGLASVLGVQPEIDVIERMATLQSSESAGKLKLLYMSGKSASLKHKTLPTVLFVWGARIIPCQITSCSIDNKAFLPGLIPYRASVNLGLTVREDHSLYVVEEFRQLAMTVAYYIDKGSQILSSI